jgi:hypothetical protein
MARGMRNLILDSIQMTKIEMDSLIKEATSEESHQMPERKGVKESITFSQS